MFAPGASRLGRSRSYLQKSPDRPLQWIYPLPVRNCSCLAPLQKQHKVKSIGQGASQDPTPNADHRDLSAQLDLLSFNKYSPGSPLFHADGSHMFLKLQAFLRAQHTAYGFQEVVSPTIYKKSLWQLSGHWDNYSDDMFEVTGRGVRGTQEGGEIGEDESYGLKPMNCPGHCLVFDSQNRSYRDLPIRYTDFGPLHRNEISGALSGLTRARRFHQDDGHIFCRPIQIGDEIKKQLQLVGLVYETLGFKDFELVLSTRPDSKYIGTPEEWDAAETQLRSALDSTERQWTLNSGDGAFYGPKIDIMLKDSNGKSHQTATIQLDFQLPQRFGLKYIAPAPEHEAKGQMTEDPKLLAISGPVAPVMIHRAVLGSLERFMALLIEHHKGKWPFWMSPRQVAIIPVVDDFKVVRYCKELSESLSGNGTEHQDKVRHLYRRTYKVHLDTSGDSVRAKVKRAKSMRYSMIVVIGQKELQAKRVKLDILNMSNVDKVAKRCKSMIGQSASDLRAINLEASSLRTLMDWVTDEFL